MDKNKIMFGFGLILAFFALITWFAETCFLVAIILFAYKGAYKTAAFLLVCFALYIKFGG